MHSGGVITWGCHCAGPNPRLVAPPDPLWPSRQGSRVCRWNIPITRLPLSYTPHVLGCNTHARPWASTAEMHSGGVITWGCHCAGPNPRLVAPPDPLLPSRQGSRVCRGNIPITRLPCPYTQHVVGCITHPRPWTSTAGRHSGGVIAWGCHRASPRLVAAPGRCRCGQVSRVCVCAEGTYPSLACPCPYTAHVLGCFTRARPWTSTAGTQ
jgi:hypothetical protein